MKDVKVKHIRFYLLCRQFYFPHRLQLQQFLGELFKKEGYNISAINYIFCDDKYLLPLNQHYLRHDTHTDILTFELSKKKNPLIADIYISIERVKENSKIYSSTFLNELYRVIFHGALHLCGYKDGTQKEIDCMRYKENYYLNCYLSKSRKNSFP